MGKITALRKELFGCQDEYGEVKKYFNKLMLGLADEIQEKIEAAKKLVLLTDNCGEIVMDKLLIATLKKLHPQLEITVLVKGGNVLNDATIEDAEQVGLTQVARVMGNGNSIAGTWEPALSPEARAEFEEADIILSKGQANYETLRLCGRNIYYIFLCKCDMFAKDFGVEPFTGMFLREKERYFHLCV